MIYINSYKQLCELENFNKKIKDKIKSLLINNLLKKKFNFKKGFIIYPFYHHIFDDEIQNFNSQLNFMRNYGDFISYDDSLKILKSGVNSKDRYFCLSFDDGFKNLFNNVSEILINFKIPSTFFIPTSFIDNKREDSGKIFFNNNKIAIEFLSWDDCKKMLSEKLFTFGSHSINHNLISKLSKEDSIFEIVKSKEIIENKLGIACNHFAPPVGDFSVSRDKNLIQNAGYKSLSTTVRGKMTEEQMDVFFLNRHHLLCNWNNNYLNYFFSI